MKAEIIAVGSELLTPDHVDTNSLFLTQKLNEVGFQVHLKSIVGDDENDLRQTIQAALGRSELILLSGGLGPTEDDRTRTAVANALGRNLRLDPELLERLEKRFAKYGFQMPLNNRRQAEVIDGAEILPNLNGTAPGMWLETKEARMALLPGPPREIQPMFEGQVLPRISHLAGSRHQERRALNIVGLTESDVDARIAPIYTTYPDVETTILAQSGHIGLRLYQWVQHGREPKELIELCEKISHALGDAVFTHDNESLEEVVGRLLSDEKQTLAVAESCTSGVLAARITNVEGSSNYFKGGVLCYSNEVKVKLCGVAADTLGRHGAVSNEVARELAEGVREKLGSSIGLSVTGIAGPGGGSPEKPVGLVFIGLSDGKRTQLLNRVLPGNRTTIRERATSLALNGLRTFVMQTSTPSTP